MQQQAAGAMPCRELQLELGKKTLIMGILNVTPDSFSDGGCYFSTDAALAHAKQMVAEGADIIDVGGESTRPGHEPVPADEEIRRILPVIRALKQELGVPISVDTYKAEVAAEALAAGAHIINDVWGFKADAEMAGVAARYDCPVILMHNRKEPVYQNFIPDVLDDLRASIRIATAAGVREERIILDPGIGFAKDYAQNLLLMRHLHEVVKLGYPVLLGTSRKSMIRRTLDLPPDDVVEGSLATAVWGISQGCAIVRVHDVRQTNRAAAMTDAILRSGQAGI